MGEGVESDRTCEGRAASTFLIWQVYHAASTLMRKLKIDDPLDAFAVHGATGMWGLLAAGIFTELEYS